MLKYLVACSATIYCMMLVFGDESRRPEVSRQSQDEITGFSLAAFRLPDNAAPARVVASDISEAEAVRIALAAGRDYRAAHESTSLRGIIAAVENAPAPAETGTTIQAAGIRYVTGSRVNLRSGPGTANAVVGQLFLGDATEILADRNGWYQIRTADGSVSGWIFGEFLAEQRPG